MTEYIEDIKRYATSLTKNRYDADDIVQDTYLKVLSTDIKNTDNIKGYLFMSTHSVYIDSMRRKIIFDDINDYPEKIINYSSYIQQIKDVVKKQKYSKAKECFMMHYYWGFLYREIAEISGINLNSVKSNIRNFREKIKTLIKDETRNYQTVLQ